MPNDTPSTHQKALTINLDDKIYGTIAEIGAAQEVARWFFQVGAAAGSVAKTLSAYDKQLAWAKFWLVVGAVLVFYALANAEPLGEVRVTVYQNLD